MKAIIRYWLEWVVTAFVVVGILLLVSHRERPEVLDLVLGVGILGTLLLTAGALTLSRKQAGDLNRPYIGTVYAAIPPESWDDETSTGWAVFKIRNSGKVPGRIKSHLTQVGANEAMPQTGTRGDMLFPEDTIDTGWIVSVGDTVVKTIEYERVDGRRKYSYRVEYRVERSHAGQPIMTIIDRQGS